MCQLCDAVFGEDRDGLVDSSGLKLEDINPAVKDGDLDETYNTMTKTQVEVIRANPDIAAMMVNLAESSYNQGYKDAMSAATRIVLDVVSGR